MPDNLNLDLVNIEGVTFAKLVEPNSFKCNVALFRNIFLMRKKLNSKFGWNNISTGVQWKSIAESNLRTPEHRPSRHATRASNFQCTHGNICCQTIMNIKNVY